MTIDINVVIENLNELLTNSVNLTDKYYDLFINPEPMLVDLELFNEDNELVVVTVPNRAKDRETFGTIIEKVNALAEVATTGEYMDLKNVPEEINALKDQNTGIVKTWTGTKVEYDTIATKDSSTLYFCTDTGNLYKGTTLVADKNILYNETGNNTDGSITQQKITSLAKFSNLPTFGSLNYEDGIVSGFNVDSWGEIFSFHPSSNTWKINWKFTYKTSSSDNQVIIDMTNGFDDIRPLTCFISHTTSKLCYGLSSDGTTFDILNQVNGSHSLIDGTTYYLELEFTGTQYIFSLSTDGTTYETDLSVTSSTPIYDTSDYAIRVGLFRTGSSAIFLDSMDLNYCSIDIGGLRVWEGTKIIDTLEDLQNVIYQYNPSPMSICSYTCPSTSYTDITKPATGGRFTAPHDGFIMFAHRVASVGQFIALSNGARHIYTQANASGNEMLLRIWLPCRKGDTITIEYSGSSTSTTANSLRCLRAIGGR